MNQETELRRGSDTFLKRVERLHELEDAKRQAEPGSPEMLNLTRRIEELAGAVLNAAGRQSDLAELAARRRPTRMRPIADVPPRPIPEILAEWRECERQLESLPPGSTDWEEARADAESLRQEYGRAHEARQG